MCVLFGQLRKPATWLRAVEPKTRKWTACPIVSVAASDAREGTETSFAQRMIRHLRGINERHAKRVISGHHASAEHGGWCVPFAPPPLLRTALVSARMRTRAVEIRAAQRAADLSQ